MTAKRPTYQEMERKVKELETQVSALKQTEEALRKSEERLKEAQRIGKMGYWEFTLESQKLIWSDQVYEIFNRDPSQGPPDFVKELGQYYPDDSERMQRDVLLSIDTGKSAEMDYQVRLPSGKAAYHCSTFRPLKDHTGNVKKVVGTVQDITERKLQEKELRESYEQLKMLAYSVSHDLKNPSLGIYWLAKRLYDNFAERLDEKGKHCCVHLLKAAENISALVDEINQYISTKEMPLKIESISLKEIFQIVRENFSPQLSARRIKFTEPTSPPIVNGDRTSILRVMNNLVDNALKYGGNNLSEIHVTCEESDKYHILCVKDDGKGVEAEEHEKLFKMFKRGLSSEGIEGSGLGLFIVKEIADRHKGKAWAESVPEKGLSVYFAISK